MTNDFAKLYTDAAGDQVLVVMSTTAREEPCINFTCQAHTMVGDDTRRLVMMQLRYASEDEARAAFSEVTEASALEQVSDLRRRLAAQLKAERVQLATRSDLN